MLQTTLRAEQAQALLGFLTQAAQNEVIIEVDTDPPQIRLKWGAEGTFYLGLPLMTT
jgi:hypothetical protein